jgi:hypothetical protein
MNLTEATPKLLFSNVPPYCHDDYLWAWVEAELCSRTTHEFRKDRGGGALTEWPGLEGATRPGCAHPGSHGVAAYN